MVTVTPSDLVRFFPDAKLPDVTRAHFDLAALWFQQQLAERDVTADTLAEPQLTAAKMAVGATALAFHSDLAVAQKLLAKADTTPGRVIEQVKVVDEIEVKFRAPEDPLAAQRDTVTSWADLALKYLALALPVRRRRPTFFGAAK